MALNFNDVNLTLRYCAWLFAISMTLLGLLTIYLSRKGPCWTLIYISLIIIDVCMACLLNEIFFPNIFGVPLAVIIASETLFYSLDFLIQLCFCYFYWVNSKFLVKQVEMSTDSSLNSNYENRIDYSWKYNQRVAIIFSINTVVVITIITLKDIVPIDESQSDF